MPDERPADAMIIELASRGIKATKSDGYEIQVGGISVMVEPAGWTIAASYNDAPNLGAHVAAALDAITAIMRSRGTMAMATRISELEAYIDEGRPPHCHHTGYGGHQPWHGGHGFGFDGHDGAELEQPMSADELEAILTSEDLAAANSEINRLRTEYAALQIDVDRRVAEAVAAERVAMTCWIDKRLHSVREGIIERRANGYGRSLPWMCGEEKVLMDARSAITAGKHVAETSTPAPPETWEASVCNFHGGGVWGAGATCRAALDAAVVALRARGDTVLMPDGSTVEAVAYKNPVWSRVDGGDEAITSSDDSMWFSITIRPDRHEVADLSTEEAPDADDEVPHA